MNAEPCKVCSSTDVNLVDGFYYCVECGTQDANVREVLVEDQILADGTFAVRRKTKVRIASEETHELSKEWHKWHAFNFMLSGLADELIAAGAKPTFKIKLLYLWTEYIKKFQHEEELGLTKTPEDIGKENETCNVSEEEEEEEEDPNDKDIFEKNNKKSRKKTFKLATDLSVIKKGLLFSFLYVALNLDGSEIQMTDLLRFLREGRINIDNSIKYVPQEIKLESIPQWLTFMCSRISSINVPNISLSVFKLFNIVPVMPDLRLIVDRFVKELCMPNDFKNLVFSLLKLSPCEHFLEMDICTVKTYLRLPVYELTVMAYVLVAFKMCFGLDDEYEMKLSDAVQRINDENCYLKSYKLDNFSEPSDRLFSFREWCSFVQLRKIILCKYNLHLAEQYLLDIDDYVYMEQCHSRKRYREPVLSDEITMNILEKIPQINSTEVIPKSEFTATLTPLSTYTEVVLQYFKDPDLRLLFSEDFTQYSLKYAVEKLDLKDEDDVSNIILGVDECKKHINKEIAGRLAAKSYDTKMVFVRNCENKNWVKTKQPTVLHISTSNEKSSDKESDHGYDSNLENGSEIEVSSKDEIDSTDEIAVDAKEKVDPERKLEIIEEEDISNNIFGDEFDNIKEEDVKSISHDYEQSNEQVADSLRENVVSDHLDDLENSINHNDIDLFFNPNTFDREKTIRELILATCKKYKIKVPDEYIVRKPAKRKSKLHNDLAGVSKAKQPRIEQKPRQKRGEGTEVVNKLLADYYDNLKNDLLLQVSEHVKAVVNNANHHLEATPADRINSGVSNVDIAERDITPNNQGDFVNSNDKNDYRNDNDDQISIQIENNNTEVDGNASNFEQSILQVSEENDNLNRTKSDPRFDEKEYDIKQLYVKVEGEADPEEEEDVFDIADDPEVAAILDKKIEEINNRGMSPFKPTLRKEDYDSEDDIPLTILKEAKNSLQRKKQSSNKLEPLVKYKEHVKEFKYWTRFHSSVKMRKLYELNEPFTLELHENYPKSFSFVIWQCAGIVNCSPFQLNKAMVTLEKRLIYQNR